MGEQDSNQDEAAFAEPSPQVAKASPGELPTSLSPEQRWELSQQNEARHDWIEQLGAQDRQVKGCSYQHMADYFVSTTDPDATLMETCAGLLVQPKDMVDKSISLCKPPVGSFFIIGRSRQACAGYIGYPFQNEEKKAVRSIFLPPYW